MNASSYKIDRRFRFKNCAVCLCFCCWLRSKSVTDWRGTYVQSLTKHLNLETRINMFRECFVMSSLVMDRSEDFLMKLQEVLMTGTEWRAVLWSSQGDLPRNQFEWVIFWPRPWTRKFSDYWFINITILIVIEPSNKPKLCRTSKPQVSFVH